MDISEGLPDSGRSGVPVGDVRLLRRSESLHEVGGDDVVPLLPLQLSGSPSVGLRELGRVVRVGRRFEVCSALLASRPCERLLCPISIVPLSEFDDSGGMVGGGSDAHWGRRGRERRVVRGSEGMMPNVTEPS
jgi:hypothetical protein